MAFRRDFRGSRKRRFTSGGSDSTVLPIREARGVVVEKACLGVRKAGMRKSGREAEGHRWQLRSWRHARWGGENMATLMG